MSGFASFSSVSCLKKWFAAFTLGAVLVPVAAGADPLLLLHADIGENNLFMPEVVRVASKKAMDIGINDNGDLVIKHKTVMMTVAYNPPAEVIDPKERIRIAQQQQDCPPISGLSLKLSFRF